MKTSKKIGLDGPRIKGFSYITVTLSIVWCGTLSIVWCGTFRVDGRQQEEIKKSGLSESIKKLGAMLSFSALYLGCPWILDW